MLALAAGVRGFLCQNIPSKQLIRPSNWSRSAKR